MKRWLLYGAALLTAVLLMKDENRQGTDVAKLEPAQILAVEESGGGLSVRTDMGHSGWGTDLESAIADMKMTASGQVFLDTAEYLLVSPGAMKWMPELSELLRSSCQVCLAGEVEELTAVAEFLSGHEPGYTLGDWRKGTVGIPVLYLLKERMYLAEP